MDVDVNELYKPVSALTEDELAKLKGLVAEYKRTGAILDLGPFDTRKFVDVNDETVRQVQVALGRL